MFYETGTWNDDDKYDDNDDDNDDDDDVDVEYGAWPLVLWIHSGGGGGGVLSNNNRRISVTHSNRRTT